MTMADFPIIGIGASAGGIDAFHSFFDHMPADCGMAFVTVLHLPADRKSMLTEILARWTQMPVIDVTDRVAIQAQPCLCAAATCHRHAHRRVFERGDAAFGE